MYTTCSKALITPHRSCFAALSHLSFFVLPKCLALPACAFLLTPCSMPRIPAGQDTITKEGHNVLGALEKTPSACKDCGMQWEMVGI